MDKEKAVAQNRARVQKHRRRKQERASLIIKEVLQCVEPKSLYDADGRLVGKQMSFKVPAEVYDRFERLAIDHGRTVKQLMDEVMVVYGQEQQRMKDEQN